MTTTEINTTPENEIEIDTTLVDTPEVEDTEEEVTEVPEPITLDELIATLVQTMGDEITAYGLHSLINHTFKAFGVDREIPPQMMYNYARQGMIVKGHKGTRKYTQEEAYTFVLKYTAKRITK